MSRSPQRASGAHAVLAAAILCLAVAPGCDVDEPARLTSNLRVASFAHDTAGAASGTVTVGTDTTTIVLDLANLPVLPLPGDDSGWEYEGWLAYEDSTQGVTTITMGRFTVTRSNSDPLFARGEGRIVYGRSGTMDASDGATKTGEAATLPDSIDFGAGVTCYLTIEPEFDDDPNSPHPTRLLMLVDSIPAIPETVEFLVPVDFDRSTAGDLTRLTSTITINTLTGEYEIELASMGFINRNAPRGPLDPGIIYQMWFVDDDTNPPRFTNQGRFNANLVGVATLTAALNPGDTDGDGVPEPLDIERAMISIEPDAITRFQVPGSGVDTSPDIFEQVPYIAELPEVTFQ